MVDEDAPQTARLPERRDKDNGQKENFETNNGEETRTPQQLKEKTRGARFEAGGLRIHT